MIGLLGAVTGLNLLQVFGMFVFLTFGLGAAPWQLNRLLRLGTRLMLGVLVSLSVLMLGSTLMVMADWWHPRVAMVVLGLISLAVHGIGLRLAIGDRTDERFHARTNPRRADVHVEEHQWWRVWSQSALAVGGLLICLATAVNHQHLIPSFGGFVVALGLPWILGLAMIVIAVAGFGQTREVHLAVAATSLIVALTLTPAITYDGPRSQSAPKHVDLIEQILTLGHLDSSLPVYNDWPGMFGMGAWLMDLTGISDGMALARCWPALIAIFRILALRYFFSRILKRPHQVWLAVTLAFLADPIGMDYFSPQSVGLPFGLALFGLALSRTRTTARLVLMLVAGSALTVSHQLSPYIVGGVLLILGVAGLARPRWIAATVLVPAMGWALVHFSAISNLLNLGDAGNLSNFRPPKTEASAALERLPIVTATVVALVVGILLVGLLAAWSLWKERRAEFFSRLVKLKLYPRETLALAMAAAPAVGLAIVFTNPYGQEGIFRAAMFGTPWLAVLAAYHFLPKRKVLNRLPILAVVAALTLSYTISAFGLDRTNVVRLGDLTAVKSFASHAEPVADYDPQYLLVLGEGDLPLSPPRLNMSADTVDRTWIKMPVEQQPEPYDGTVQMRALTDSVLKYTGVDAATVDIYAIWSPVQSAYGLAYGIQTEQQFAALRDAFAAAPYWKVEKDEGGTLLWKLDNKLYLETAGAGR